VLKVYGYHGLSSKCRDALDDVDAGSCDAAKNGSPFSDSKFKSKAVVAALPYVTYFFQTNPTDTLNTKDEIMKKKWDISRNQTETSKKRRQSKYDFGTESIQEQAGVIYRR
jgi:hypothetical protein